MPLVTPVPVPSKPSEAQSRPPPHSQAISTSSNGPRQSLSDDHHKIMLRHGLSRPTIRSLTMLPRAPEPNEILRCASSATELRSFTFHPAEKGAFSAVNNDPSTRWPIKETISQSWHKVFLVAQCEASGGDYGDRLPRLARKQLNSDRPRIVKTLGHILRACADVMGARRDAIGLRPQPTELLQVPDIGPKKVAVLIEHGILTVRQLADLDFFHIERILSRNPPFGQKILRSLAHFPRLVMAVDVAKREMAGDVIIRAVLGCSNQEAPVWNEKAPFVTLAAETSDGRLVFFWRGKIKTVMSGKELVFPVKDASKQTVFVWASCEEVAGTWVTGEVAV
ncbi:putative ATP-dependent DNA helicase HFM1 [Colletotrichum chlorophyti]|uniref:Putative ATP-dependent DNA helicase HFM1 n=1 Tax=Colletotrichum chlorophyti TaxID=708187 RepID=A0A1Q8RS11_9PEZI|nr:putative ATP-dependent DNA helicase HFM1 [Colletotrichum chlorophyti]